MTGRAMVLCLCLGLCLVGLGQSSELGASGDISEQRGSTGGSDTHLEHSGVGAGSNEVSAHKGAPQAQSQDNYNKQDSGSGSPVIKYPPPHEATNKGDLPSMFNLSEYAKLIFSPLEMVKKISDAFRLPQDKLIEKLGKGMVFGAEALLTPVIASLKIIEKVFVPDQCRMKLLCQIGCKFSFVKDTISRFSPNLFQGSAHLKALTDGMSGQNCDIIFKDCEPKLKKPYDELKSGQ